MIMCNLRHKPSSQSFCKNAFAVNGSFVREALASQPSTSEAVLQNVSSSCKLSFKCEDFSTNFFLSLFSCWDAWGCTKRPDTPAGDSADILPLWSQCEPSDHLCARKRMHKYGRSHSCFEGEEGSVAALCQLDNLLLQMRSWHASGDVCSGWYPL